MGLNSTSFNAARMIGPAVAGMMIAAVGTGWVFLIHAASFGAVLVLAVLPAGARPAPKRAARAEPVGMAEGFRYVWRRPEQQAALLMLFLVGTFGVNFPIFISTMSVSVFHKGAGEYGLLTSIMAVGSVSGAFLAAGARARALPPADRRRGPVRPGLTSPRSCPTTGSSAWR